MYCKLLIKGEQEDRERLSNREIKLIAA
jgi:hypothetical protein